MNKYLSFYIILIGSIISLQAQNNFASGSYTDLNGNITEGFISLEEDTSTPQSFLFKTNLNAEPISITKNTANTLIIKTLEEERKFISKSVLVYEANDTFDKLDNQREVIFSTKDLFVEVVLEGDVSLYNLKRINKPSIFFYSDSKDKIVTLVQKKYRGFQNEVKTNNSYKQQLSTLLKCDDEKTLNFQSLNYNKKSLLKLFQTYYQCSNSRSNFVVKEKKEKLVNIKVIAGAGISSLTTRTLGDNDATFGNSNYTIFGAELEYHFNKKRNWALVLSIAPFKFSNLGSNDVLLGFPSSQIFTIENKAEISGIDFNLGVRHYAYLNNESALFVGLFFDYDLISETNFQFLNIDREGIAVSEGAPNFSIGAGYQWKRLSVELKYHTPKDHLGQGSFFSRSRLQRSSITLRYKLLNL